MPQWLFSMESIKKIDFSIAPTSTTLTLFSILPVTTQLAHGIQFEFVRKSS